MTQYITMPQTLAGSPEQQLGQMQRYLFQMIGQLNYALGTIDGTAAAAQTTAATAAKSKTELPSAQSTFNRIKSLIIKSAEIVEAYEEQITAHMAGEYVAVSDFGVYQKNTEAAIRATSEGIDQLYGNIQSITTELDGIGDMLIETSAYIRTGLLLYDESGAPLYGVEIGQQTTEDGAQVFRKYTRMVAGRLSFFDANDVEVAYVSDRKLYVGTAEIQQLNAREIQTERITLKNYMIEAGQDGHLTIT